MKVIKALELLKEKLDEIPKLRGNHEFKLWLSAVETIIKHGLDKDDYNNFSSVKDKYFLEDDLGLLPLEAELDYPQKIKDYKTAVKSIIQKYEMLGVKEKPHLNKVDKPKSIPKKLWQWVKTNKLWSIIIIGIPVLAALIYVIDYFCNLFSK